MAKKTFVLNNQTILNTHGFYLLNEGGEFTRFNENPVMLNNHHTDMCIGLWENLRIENDELLADAVFDKEDPDAAKIMGKVERGFLKGCSPGICILDAQMRADISGDEKMYVTKWELFEASVCSIPSNAGALSLKIYDQNRQLLSDDQVPAYLDNIVKLSLDKTNQKINTNQVKMEKIMLLSVAFVALGLQDNADAKTINDAIVRLNADKESAVKELTELKVKIESEKEKASKEMIELALLEGRFTVNEKEHFCALAKVNPELCKKTIEMLPKKQNLSTGIRPISTGSSIPKERETWNLSAWMKNDMAGLNRLKTEDTQAYEKIINNK